MNLRETVRSLCHCFEQEADALDALTIEVQKQRLAYVSLLPRELEQAVARMEGVRVGLEAATRDREQATDALRRALGLTDDVRLRDLLPRLPPTQRSDLKHASERAGKAARTLRVENAVGARILAFAERAQDALVHRIAGASEAPPCYDRNARVHRTPGGGGSLISGTA